jgi:hypothetical protein
LAPDLERQDVRRAVRNGQRSGPSTSPPRAVKRRLTLELGPLGKDTLEEQAEAAGLSVAAVLRYSALYYISERDPGRLAWRVPRFARTSPADDTGDEELLEVTLDLDEHVWCSLEAESVRQEVPLTQLLKHAAFFFVSDLALGRVPAHLLGDHER